MQKNEIIDAILTETRKNPKITNNELSLKLLLHRNTISKYRKYIRQTFHKTPQEIVNKIDSRLDEELNGMSHTTILTYRGQLVPKKIEAQTEHHEVHEDVKRLEIVQLMKTYGEAVEDAVRRNMESLTKDADKQRLDTAHAHAKTS